MPHISEHLPKSQGIETGADDYLSEMLREFVAQATIKASGHDINITASFGLSGLESLNDAGDVTPEKLLNQADEHLYQAKEEGRNRVVG